jgi:hypothetical protein
MNRKLILSSPLLGAALAASPAKAADKAAAVDLNVQKWYGNAIGYSGCLAEV